jgi:hypothetical protein
VEASASSLTLGILYANGFFQQRYAFHMWFIGCLACDDEWGAPAQPDIFAASAMKMRLWRSAADHTFTGWIGLQRM